MSKKIIAASLLFIMLSTVLVGCLQGRGDEVVAVINGREVPRSEFDKYLDLSINLYSDFGIPQEEEKKYLDFYINEELFYLEALERGIEVTEAEIDEDYQESRAYLIQEYFDGDEDQFIDRMKRLGLVEEDLRELVVRNLVITKFIEELEQGLESVSEEDINNFYEEYLDIYFTRSEMRQIRHILVDSESVAESILVKLEKGEDFAELAEEYSLDYYSAIEGGTMDYTARGSYVEPFDDVAFTLPIGEVSGVVETEFGYHIIEVMDILEGGIMELDDDLKEDIEFFIIQERQADLINDILGELREGDVENRL